ncbi:MAG: hypothetical protein E7644_01030 [Ruminococcaceae bacterium]|nr:hypothetical protein [Oscillospiraceae bacterium]
MKSKVWFWVSIAAIVLLITSWVGMAFLIVLQPNYDFIEAKNEDLTYYLELPEDNNYLPEFGYVPDAKTAAQIGSAVIDNFFGQKFGGSVTVEYDSVHRLWKVHKGYLLRHGAFVIIEQDTGRIIKALKDK